MASNRVDIGRGTRHWTKQKTISNRWIWAHRARRAAQRPDLHLCRVSRTGGGRLAIPGTQSALASGGWVDNWDSAVQQAKTSGKPALVLFTADWCPACRQFESETLTDPQVKQYLKDNHTLVVVDLTDRTGPNTNRAREFSVQAIPTLILFDVSGNEKARDFGMPSEPMLKWLKTH